MRAGTSARWWSAAVAVACLAGLIVASQLRASDAGLGTHTQLGLAPCGFEAATGMPCATCGMTTSFALAADGRLIDAFHVQPFGALLALLSAVAVLLAGYAAIAGMSLMPLLSALTNSSVILTAVALLLAAWAYKMMLSIGG
ncbi:MAG: DUF2752 domain-containing protein [Phycisphaeraceae bacterium]